MACRSGRYKDDLNMLDTSKKRVKKVSDRFYNAFVRNGVSQSRQSVGTQRKTSIHLGSGVQERWEH